MATAVSVQRTSFTYRVKRFKPRGANGWLWSGGLARDEARSMLAMMQRTGASIEDMRELIEVPEEEERILRLYARQNPEDGAGIERVIQFRKRVAEEFERLLTQGTRLLHIPQTFISPNQKRSGSIRSRYLGKSRGDAIPSPARTLCAVPAIEAMPAIIAAIRADANQD